MGSGFLGSPYSHPSDFVRDGRWIEAMNASFLCLKKGIAIYAPIVHWHNVHQRHVTQFESGYFWAQNRPMLGYLSPEEIGRLGRVLSEAEQARSEHGPVIDATRLLILTGARLGEIQTLKWEHVQDGYIALPDSKTGAKRIVIGKAAAEVLGRIKRLPDNPHVITGTRPGQFWTDLQRPWRRIRARAGLPNVRIHDLRHTFASVAAGRGESLTKIGRLLGHSQVQTTARYAHLAPDPLRETADRAAGEISRAMGNGELSSRVADSTGSDPNLTAE